MTIDQVHLYQSQTRELLVKRALGLLTLDDEAEIAEQLDDIWRVLSEEEHEEIENWLRSLAPSAEPTDASVHELSVAVAVEADPQEQTP